MINSLPSSHVPELICENLCKLISNLTTRQQQKVLENIVMSGSLVTSSFLDSLQEKLKSYLDPNILPFKFHKFVVCDDFTVPFDHQKAASIGAVCYYEKKIIEHKSSNTLNSFLDKHYWLIGSNKQYYFNKFY